MSRFLRSRHTSLTHVYLLQRLVTHIDEPWRTRATQQLRLVLQFKGGDTPPANVPLRLPPLAHNLAGQVRSLVRTLTQMERVNFPPLHLPSASLVELKSKPLHQVVFNYRKFLRTWTPSKTPMCRCEQWRQVPEAITSTGHVMCHVRHAMPDCHLASANL